MKNWISLLLAGILVSALMVGCKKEEEGSTTPAAEPKAEGKMDAAPEDKMGGEKAGEAATPAAETK